MTLSKLVMSAIISCTVLLALNSCSKSGSGNGYDTSNPPPPTSTAPGKVTISGMTFIPSTITVKAGTKITWTNNDGYSHTVTADDGTTFDSGNIGNGVTYSFTPTAKGTITYHCNIHSSMTATIVVE